MVNLIGNYKVLVDEYNYTLVKDTGRVRTRKNGTVEPDYKPYGYYASLAQAIEACRQRCIREELKDGCTELCGAMRTITEVTNQFRELLERCLPEDDLK